MCCVCERELFAGVFISNHPQLLKANMQRVKFCHYFNKIPKQRQQVTQLANIYFNVPVTNITLYKLNAQIFILQKSEDVIFDIVCCLLLLLCVVCCC